MKKIKCIMPINKKYLADFEEEGIYHIYNKTNNKELLFLSDENRLYFLKKYNSILSPFIDTYCWCLLPNHFHILIKVKKQNVINDFLSRQEKVKLSITEKRFLLSEISLGDLIEQSFKRFFQSYAQAFNKENERSGNLFYKPFKRILIDSVEYFTQTIIYIHANAQKHGIVKDFTKYKWSSWNSILSLKNTNLLRDELISWFGSREKFIKVHLDNVQYYYEYDTNLEE
jgi:putative transposase